MESSIAQQLINKFDEHGSFIDLYGIAEAFNQDKNKSLIILSEFLTEQDTKNKQLLDEIDKLKSKVSNWMDKYTEVNKENKKLKSELKDKDIDLQHYKKMASNNNHF